MSEAFFEHMSIKISKEWLPFTLETQDSSPLSSTVQVVISNTHVVQDHGLLFTLPIANFNEQKIIATSRVKKFLVTALHYHLDLPTVIRSLGGNYTGEYGNTSSTLKALQATHCDELVISDFKYTLLAGCPNKMNASSSYTNFYEFKRYGNHTTIKKRLDQVMQTLNKENRNQYFLLFPNWSVPFFKNIHLTPPGLLSKPDKNGMLIWDGSF